MFHDALFVELNNRGHLCRHTHDHMATLCRSICEQEVGGGCAENWSGGWEQNEVTVTRDDVETIVPKLINEGKNTKGMWMRAKLFGVKASRALEEGGSYYNIINLLIQGI